MAFVLSGTIADFKEAERLPGEIACQLEILEDWLAECVVQQRSHSDKKDVGPPLKQNKVLGELLATTDELIAWFQSSDKKSEVLYPSVKRLDAQIKVLVTYASLKGITVRIYGDMNTLRKAVSRAYTIARTDFLGSAYSLFEAFLAFLGVLLMLCKFKNAWMAAVICGFVSLTYWYLYRLIRDVDNPFSYGVGNNEVSLHLLLRYRERLAECIAGAATP
jgi:hypothetical protein